MNVHLQLLTIVMNSHFCYFFWCKFGKIQTHWAPQIKHSKVWKVGSNFNYVGDILNSDLKISIIIFRPWSGSKVAQNLWLAASPSPSTAQPGTISCSSCLASSTGTTGSRTTPRRSPLLKSTRWDLCCLNTLSYPNNRAWWWCTVVM